MARIRKVVSWKLSLLLGVLTLLNLGVDRTASDPLIEWCEECQSQEIQRARVFWDERPVLARSGEAPEVRAHCKDADGNGIEADWSLVILPRTTLATAYLSRVSSSSFADLELQIEEAIPDTRIPGLPIKTDLRVRATPTNPEWTPATADLDILILVPRILSGPLLIPPGEEELRGWFRLIDTGNDEVSRWEIRPLGGNPPGLFESVASSDFRRDSDGTLLANFGGRLTNFDLRELPYVVVNGQCQYSFSIVVEVFRTRATDAAPVKKAIPGLIIRDCPPTP